MTDKYGPRLHLSKLSFFASQKNNDYRYVELSLYLNLVDN